VPLLFNASFRRLLCLCFLTTLPFTTHAQSVPARVLFDDPPPVEGGWKGLAQVLEALSPGVDTAAPLTPADVTARIATMLNAGQYEQALGVIEKFETIRDEQQALGTDVQLLFQKGRALSGLARVAEATALYQDMTVRFPELPEPWNNLAVEYLKQDQLDRARDALQMALSADPHYLTAQINLGRVYLLLSRQAFEQAARQGHQQAARSAAQIGDVLQVY